MRRPNFLQGDTSFLAALGLLIVLGLIFLASASAPLAFNRFGNHSYFLYRQISLGVIPGIALFLLTSRIRRSALIRLAFPFFAVCLILLALIFVPGLGVAHGRTQSWLQLTGFAFQPAEIAKLGLILALAAFFTVRRPDWFELRSWLRGLLPFIIILGAVAGLIALQPDVGTLIIIAAIGLVVLFAAGSPWLHIGAMLAVGLAAFTGLIAAAPYRLARLSVFLHPEFDPRGIGYQVNQALLAIGSGGIFGVGLGHSRQKFAFVPEIVSDSIFAIIAEEIGFLFSVCFIALLVYVIWRVFANALRAADAFDRLVLVGIGVWWGSQALVNVGAMVGLFPLTGLPLPFVSYGGTAMAVSLAAAGMVMNLSRHQVKP